MKNRSWIVIALVLAILACNIPSPQTGETPTPTATVTATETRLPTEAPPTLTPSPTATVPASTATPPLSASPTLEPPSHGEMLYETRFAQGWPPLEGDKANGQIVSGGFQIDITQPWALYAYTTRARQSTFFAEVTAAPLSCPPGNGGYGMIFHYQSDTSFRYVTIWCSGRYSLLERTGPTSTVTLGEGSLPEEIDASTGEHTVSVRALANKLTVYIDDRQIAQVTVASMPTGDVGPYVETTGQPISVLFTRLSVYAAE